jgi:sugar phosphate isomerase/epimerase
MTQQFNRRSFLKTTGALGLGLGMLGKGVSRLGADEPDSSLKPDLSLVETAKGAPHAEKIGWRLGIQAWTFHDNTLFEAIDNTAQLGLKYIEAFPGQSLSKDQPDIKVNETLPADARKTLKTKLSDSGVKLVNFGVCNLTKNEADSRRMFEFAKDMGVETLVAEPPEDAFDILDKMCGEYNINIAIHDHPKPSHYWNPETVLKVCEGRSRRIGACADTGHWVRSGLDPLESLKKLEGRLISFHFKDLDKLAPDAHDVPWGTGASNVEAMLTEIYRQKIKAVFSIEYEYHWGKAMPEIARCVAFFDAFAATLDAKQ